MLCFSECRPLLHACISSHSSHHSDKCCCCRLLSTHEADQKQLELICIALDKVLASQHGTDLLLGAQQYAEAALASPQHRLRLLGVQQLGRLLLLRADQQQEAMQLETSLIKALQVGRNRWPAAPTNISCSPHARMHAPLTQSKPSLSSTTYRHL